jgi:cell division protein FtsW
MTILATRADVSIVGRWWWTVDRWLLVALAILMLAGALFAMAASPSVAERIGLSSFHFVRRQMMFLPLAGLVMIGFSMMSVQMVRRSAVVLFGVFFGLTALTLIVGTELNGAQRWLSIAGFALQPSEFLKPTLIVACAWMFSEQFKQPDFPGNRIAAALGLLSIGLLIMQPDFGQSFLIFVVWSALFFMAGLPVSVIALLVVAGLVTVVAAYNYLPHVTSRIDRFLDPASGDTYQIETAMNAFQAGGFFGRGPGEGMVKRVLPDAHTDFIFAVIGEEFGLFACLGLVLMFGFIVVRGLLLLLREEDPFVFLSVGGLLGLFGLQSLINIGVNLNLLPAKGMTLPFISYGGSSLLAMAMAMGMVLALTRRRKYDPAWEGRLR